MLGTTRRGDLHDPAKGHRAQRPGDSRGHTCVRRHEGPDSVAVWRPRRRRDTGRVSSPVSVSETRPGPRGARPRVHESARRCAFFFTSNFP